MSSCAQAYDHVRFDKNAGGHERWQQRHIAQRRHTFALSALLPALSAAFSVSPFRSLPADLALLPISSAAFWALLPAKEQ